MVNWKVFVFGVVIIVAFYATFLLIPTLFGIQLDFLSYPLVYVTLILAGIFIAISGLLPYGWGKILRNIAYFCLFVLILILEINVMKVALQRHPTQELTLEKCTTLFGEKEQPEKIIDAVSIWSCVTTGYFPKETGDLGWTIFAIFYIILPFAFIVAFLYGIMTGIGLEAIFGNVAGTVKGVLTFVISMFAMRQLFGFFLLDMFGYGAWGLAGVFLAALFVMALRNIVEKWYRIEEYGKEMQEAMKTALEIEKNAKKALYDYVKKIKGYRGTPLYQSLQSIVGGKGTLQYQAYSNLGEVLQAQVKQTIDEIISGRKSVDDLLNLLK
ncbi:MAG: hypothetical protein QXG39_06665 [Candidatus Aenigmatarchaeota archaeon]